MDLNTFKKLVDTQVNEVAQIYSQNSTALAREFIKENAIREIVQAVLELNIEDKKEDKKETKKKN